MVIIIFILISKDDNYVFIEVYLSHSFLVKDLFVYIFRVRLVYSPLLKSVEEILDTKV